MQLRADKAYMGSGLGSFEPTMGCSRNLQARQSKFEDTSVAMGKNHCELSTMVGEHFKMTVL